MGSVMSDEGGARCATLFRLTQRFARGLTVHEAQQAKRIRVLQCGREKIVGQSLVAHRTREAIDGSGADRGEPNVGGCRIRAAVIHGGTYLHSGREAVYDDT